MGWQQPWNLHGRSSEHWLRRLANMAWLSGRHEQIRGLVRLLEGLSEYRTSLQVHWVLGGHSAGRIRADLWSKVTMRELGS